MKSVVAIIFVLFVVGCYNKPDRGDLIDIREESWVFNRGHKIGEGDFIKFETNGFYDLRGDSVFRKKTFIGKIVGYNPKRREIKIVTIDKKISFYYNHDYR